VRASGRKNRGAKPSAPVKLPGAGSRVDILRPPAEESVSALGRRPCTDLGNAERLCDLSGDDLRYSQDLDAWLNFDGRRWKVDRAGEAMTFAKQTARGIYAEAANAATEDGRVALSRHAVRTESAPRLEAMLRLAQSALPVAVDQLDRDPWLLNVQNGTIDLRTGELRRHRREDLITKLIDIPYHPDASAPRWDRFMEEVLPAVDVREFVRRAAGYSATGSVRERVLLVLYGTGRNGKGVLLQTLREILGEYAVRTPSETLLARRGDSIPNDLAALRGARIVFASETGAGGRLDEARVKDITGGEEVAARFMRAEWFTFKPTFTLWLATNHKPVVTGSDAAIWDRLRLVPFTTRFRLPEEQDDGSPLADLTLSDTLRDEHPGILAWIVRGAVDWYRSALGAPEVVRLATAGYRSDMDHLADFLEARCIADAQAATGSATIYEAYKDWAARFGERPHSHKECSNRLVEHGLSKKRTKAGISFSGVRVRTNDGDRTGVGSADVQGYAGYSRMAGNATLSHVETPEMPTSPYTLHRPTGTDDAGRCWSCKRPPPPDGGSCASCGWPQCDCGACQCGREATPEGCDQRFGVTSSRRAS
jgi:putative DNA primase/helicase